MAEIEQRPSLSLVRRFKAPPAEVWRAWTDPQALKQWMAPSDAFSVPVAETDVRVGGRYRIVMRSPDGEEHDVRGVYREVVPNVRLVYTWTWAGSRERESVVTLELREEGGGTLLTLTHEGFADASTRDRHNEGWAACIGRLERLLS